MKKTRGLEDETNLVVFVANLRLVHAFDRGARLAGARTKGVEVVFSLQLLRALAQASESFL